MSPILILLIIAAYFGVLFVISMITGKQANSDTYFKGNKNSPWYLVAFGMIGASLSGVTFISIPGWVSTQGFSYMQMVFGYLLGYAVIAFVLMPLYYRLNLTSIYSYLEERFGKSSYKTGAFFFLLSRTIGGAFRLYLVAIVIQLIMDRLDFPVPFWVTVTISIALIYLYTFRGGIKTVVWTDTLQTLFMLVSAGLAVWFMAGELNFGPTEMVRAIRETEYSDMWVWDWKAGNFFVKHVLAGAFTAIVMTGLDQDMMQKNLTCKNLGDAQKNMITFSIVLVFVNLGFLTLGALLYMYGSEMGILQQFTDADGFHLLIKEAGENGEFVAQSTDRLFPLLSLDYFPPAVTILFILGLVAAAYSSADSALASLTTSFCVDFLNFEKRTDEEKKKTTRFLVQAGFSVLLILVILFFKYLSGISEKPVVSSIFKAAGYTYGPLLGLYAFGLFSKLKVRDNLVPVICVLSPILAFVLNWISPKYIGYSIGFEILLYNGAITFLGLLLLSVGQQAPLVNRPAQ